MFGFKLKPARMPTYDIPQTPRQMPDMRELDEVRLFKKVGQEAQVNGIESLRMAIGELQNKYKRTKVESNNAVEVLICYINELQKIHDQLNQMANQVDDFYQNVSYDLKLLKNIHGYYSQKKVMPTEEQALPNNGPVK
jgi:hypothetical protein